MSEDAFYILGMSVLGVVALAGLAWMAMRSPKEEPAAELPTLLPANAPLVAVLRTVAADVEESGRRTADGLRDIARVIQLSATEPVAPAIRERIANFIDEPAAVLKRSAQRIREGH